jgi:6-phosphogluconate dehydrogenase
MTTASPWSRSSHRDRVDEFLAHEAKTGRSHLVRIRWPKWPLFKAPAPPRDADGKAGKPVDDFIEQLLGVLGQGDIIIDGWQLAVRGQHPPNKKYVESKGLLYIGTGVSGGEDGARHGPSIMPGGSKAAWEHVKPIFQAIAAKVDNGVPCCDWVGEDGAGHYVKMTHNGIEYGDMQLICDAYHLMKDGLGLTPDEMHDVFAEWNAGELDSYLIEITRDILSKKDDDRAPLVDRF